MTGDFMEKPQLKTPPQPKIAFLDLDAVLFAAASAGEQVIYVAKTPEGVEVARFNSASAHKNWLETSEEFGIDMDFGFEGDFTTLERHTEYEIKDFKECVKTFKSLVKSWFDKSGCEEYVGYLSKASGEKNFRYDVATLKAYKGSRAGTRKPHYLEELRKHVRKFPEIKTPRGPYEVDDLICAKAQAKGWKGCAVSCDKDSLGVVNTHVFIPDEMDKPMFSSNKVVGSLWKRDNGKVVGLGTLFWLYQTLAGDSVDCIPGCKGIGSKKAYDLLEPYSGVDAKHLGDALKTVHDTYEAAYGRMFEYEHCYTGEAVTATHTDLFCEMSQLVYMKKSRDDECFWLGQVRSFDNENNS